MVCRIVHKSEKNLTKSGWFRLPIKKELWQTSAEEELVVMDVKLKYLKNANNSFIVEKK